MVNKSDHRSNNFNLLRMLAAIAVLVSHAFPISFGVGAAEPLSSILQMSLGTLAVVSFFVISGFFISQSFANSSSFLAFCVARVLRIYPGLLVVLLFTVMLIGPLFTRLSLPAYFTSAETLAYIPHNLSLKWLQYELPGVFAHNPYPAAINGSLWSLFYEVVCYGMVALVAAAGIMARPSRFPLFLVLYVAVYFAAKLISPLEHYLTAHAAFLFLHELTWPFVIGMAIYRFRSLLMTKAHMVVCAAAGLLALLLFRSPFFNEVFVFFWGLLLFYAGNVRLKPLESYNRLGDYSYGMYIYAFPCEQVAVAVWPGISPIALMAVSAPATLALAAMSWHFVEKPAMSRRSGVVAWLERNLVLTDRKSKSSETDSRDGRKKDAGGHLMRSPPA